jgi:molecular chaperone GrpE
VARNEDTEQHDANAVEQEETIDMEAEEAESAEEQDELESLKAELEAAQTQAAEYLDGWQRTQAEFSNYKKRQEVDRAQLTVLANAALMRKLLPVVDDFERAMGSLPPNLSKLTWCEGVSLIKLKMDALLESEGVTSIATDGQSFDPRYHEAVTYEEVEGYADGQIIGEVQRGYMLNDRVLRPALVRVAKAPAPQPIVESEQDEDNDTTETKE